MNLINHLILTLIVAAPALAALLLTLLPSRSRALRPLALLATAFTLLLTLHLPAHFASALAPSGFAFEQDLPWIASLGIHYHLGVDGFSQWIVVMTALLALLCALTCKRQAGEHEKSFYILLLLLEAALLGVFVSLDLFLFYCFWEAVIVPMALLTGLFGQGGRKRAALRFFLYMMASSMFLLGGTIWLMTQVGSTDFTVLRAAIGRGQMTPQSLQWLFLCFFATFAVKAPLFPVHAWLPETHAAAPAVVSVLMLKMGIYGMLRFNLGLFPHESLRNQPWIAALAIATIFYGALQALAQSNLKRLLAFSSVSHAGMAVLAVFCLTPMAVGGAAFQIVNIGVTTGALFLLAGLLYERRGSYTIADYGGWAAAHPVLASFSMLFTLSAIGLPLTGGFTGEFLMLSGAWQARPLFAVLASGSVVLGAWYMLRLYKQLFFGAPCAGNEGSGAALSGMESSALAALAIAVLLLGILPSTVLRNFAASPAPPAASTSQTAAAEVRR